MFTQAITPAIKSHLEVQLAFFTELTRKLFDTAQKISELNLQLAGGLIEEMTTAHHQMIGAKDPAEFASVAASQTHAAAERMRNYQQRLSNVAANANVEITRTAENHLPEASRTAAAVADEMVRKASEETEKASQRQRAAMEKMNESARRGIDGMMQGQSRPQGQPTH